MSFLATIWLGALAALALPIALHLISRGHRRRVRVGSVRLLAPESSFRARRFQPSQLLLLLVRCGLLAALALALAEPRWWRQPTVRDDGPGWILTGPRLPEDADARLDALRDQGHTLYEGTSPDVWSMVREADALAPPGAPLFVVTENRLALLAGTRPRLRRRVEWRAVDHGYRDRWIERAGPADGDRVAVVVGTSDAAGTTFERLSLELDADSPVTGASARRTDGGVEITLADETVSLEPGVPVDVAVRYAADRAEDAGYVSAALEAAAEHLGVPVRTTVLPWDGQAPLDADLSFWLSGERTPPAVLEGSGVAVSDGLERHESCAGGAILSTPVELRRCSDAESVGGEAVLWRDGRGRPLLAASRHDNSVWYRFHGRFHPLWSDFVFTPAFPQWLLALLDQAIEPTRVYSAASAHRDLRATTDAQRLPRTQPPSEARGERRPSRVAELALWLLVAGLFAAERRLARG